MSTTRTITTADELGALPDEDVRRVLIRGKLYEMSPTAPWHGHVGARITSYLVQFVERHGLGVALTAETGFVLSATPDTVLAPDAAFVRQEKLPPADEWDRFFRFAPDLAVENVSPFDRGPSVQQKVSECLRAGTRMVWVVDPRRKTVTVHSSDQPQRVLGGADQLDGGDVLPGFRLPLRDLFR
jgi:Uma2 family endonuclease